jgi:hypothetical protein
LADIFLDYTSISFKERGKKMYRFIFGLIFASLLLTPTFAQDKVVNGTTVTFSVLSWEDIQKGLKEKPADHTVDFHLKLADAMSKVHGGGFKDAYHVMVLLTDTTFGHQISNAEVQVTAISKKGTEEDTRKLEIMNIDELPGYGEYFKLTSRGPFVFKVKLKLGSTKIHTVEFEKTI